MPLKALYTQKHYGYLNDEKSEICHLTSPNLPQFPTFAPETKVYMATTSDISRGMILKLDGSLYSVVEFGENKTARAAAKVWAKLKGVDNKRSIEKTWNSGETIFR